MTGRTPGMGSAASAGAYELHQKSTQRNDAWTSHGVAAQNSTTSMFLHSETARTTSGPFCVSGSGQVQAPLSGDVPWFSLEAHPDLGLTQHNPLRVT